ncbi:MAG: MBL fold metallo-hydrolase, partial [Microgenomates group bacterium]
IVTDPYSSSMVGFKFPKTEADIVTVSHHHLDHSNVAAVDGNAFIIEAAGEYEIRGISIFGYQTFHDSHSGAERGENIIYVIEADGLRVCHLGDLGSELSPKTLEELSEIDVLMIPVGGEFTLGPHEAAELVSQIEPKVVLPMHFQAEGLKKENFASLQPVENFLREIGVNNPEKIEKLSLTKDKLTEEMRVVLLERKN